MLHTERSLMVSQRLGHFADVLLMVAVRHKSAEIHLASFRIYYCHACLVTMVLTRQRTLQVWVADDDRSKLHLHHDQTTCRMTLSNC